MKKFNILDLEKGQNQILIESGDIPTSNKRKIPIFRIPKDSIIIDTSFRVLEPFSVFSSSQGGSASAIPVFSLGTDSEEEYFLKYQKLDEIGDFADITSSSYYDSPNYQFLRDTNIYMNVYVIPRVWSVEANMSVRRSQHGLVGHQYNAIAFAGTSLPSGTAHTTTEIFDGSTWTSHGSGTPTAERKSPGFTGTANNAFAYSGTGNGIDSFQTFNGSTWTIVDSPPVSERTWSRAFGTINFPELYIAGGTNGSTPSATTFTYDGSAITSSSTLLTARTEHTASGSASSGIIATGRTTSNSITYLTEEWDTSSYRSGPSMIRALQYASGFGSANLSVITVFGETYETDSISWFVGSRASIQRASAAACGKRSSGLLSGGNINQLEGGYLDVYVSVGDIYNIDTIEATESYGELLRQEQSVASGMMIINITIK